jgi:hypothetical protein
MTMTYKILSRRIGVVGDEFTPPEYTNIAALLEYGFIAEDTGAKKSAKTTTDETKE